MSSVRRYRTHPFTRAHPEFYSYWADGNADTFSESHLYFSNKAGDKVWHLPYHMTGEFAEPVLVEE